MRPFVLSLLGAVVIVVLFFGLAVFGFMAVNASCIIGWLACGVYSVIVFCCMGGQPENVGGTSIIMILLGALMLCVVLTMSLSYQPEPSARKLYGD